MVVFINGVKKLRPGMKQLNESCFYCSVPDGNAGKSRASNHRRLRVSLPGTYEAMRCIPTACDRKYAVCSRVHPTGRRNHAALSAFDTLLSRSDQSLATKNQRLLLCLQRSRDPSRARIHRRRAGNRNPCREMKNSPMNPFSFLLILSSFQTVEQFIIISKIRVRRIF